MATQRHSEEQKIWDLPSHIPCSLAIKIHRWKKKSHTTTLEQTVRQENQKTDGCSAASWRPGLACPAFTRLFKTAETLVAGFLQGSGRSAELISWAANCKCSQQQRIAAAPRRTVFLGCPPLPYPECTWPSQLHSQLLPLGVGKVLSKHYGSFKQQNSLAVTSTNFKGSIKALLEITLKLSIEIADQSQTQKQCDNLCKNIE